VSEQISGAGTLSAADRLIEIIAVLLLGLTTIGTAWCGFQAAQWNGLSGDMARASAEQHIDSARLYGVATQRVSYDSQIVAQYAEAKSAGNTQLLRFYRNSLMRPDFLPTLNRWEAEVDAGRFPTGLTEDRDYVTTQLLDYRKAVARAAASTAASQDAGQSADAYVATTILLAAALFFAGVTSSFRYRPARVFLLLAAIGTVAVAASRLAGLPIG
jgi:hypothetical protein